MGAAAGWEVAVATRTAQPRHDLLRSLDALCIGAWTRPPDAPPPPWIRSPPLGAPPSYPLDALVWIRSGPCCEGRDTVDKGLL